MLGIRHENYTHMQGDLPLLLTEGITRTKHHHSPQKNWHENIELQLCTGGRGTVLLNGKGYDFAEGDICVVPSDVIHYTFTEERLVYTCLIVSTDFCKEFGIDPFGAEFEPIVKSEELRAKINELSAAYAQKEAPLRRARVSGLLLSLLVELCEKHAKKSPRYAPNDKEFRAVKDAIDFIRAHYDEKITLDVLATHVAWDKYALCRAFKRYTGKTVVEFVNHHRCMLAADRLLQGASVAEAARLCGFDNLSFFTLTFKRFFGACPSTYKKQC